MPGIPTGTETPPAEPLDGPALPACGEPAGPLAPLWPGWPVEPGCPASPGEPCSPVCPGEPCWPVWPGAPGDPVWPAGWPVDPDGLLGEDGEEG